jgi:hypothetical protein
MIRMSNRIIEGFVDSTREWAGKGRVATVIGDGGTYTIGFTKLLRVPRRGVKVRIQANQGQQWLFAEKWEYLVPPKGKTKDGFPVRSDPEIESAAFKVIRSLSEFTVDDLHTPEILNLLAEKKRDRRALGSILRALKTRGLIKEARTVHSKRIMCHRRPVVLWTRTVELDELIDKLTEMKS